MRAAYQRTSWSWLWAMPEPSVFGGWRFIDGTLWAVWLPAAEAPVLS